MNGKERYVTVLYHGGEPTWFLLEKPPVGLSGATTRLKVGQHYYFITAETTVVDAASGTSVVFLQTLAHHSLWGNTINPDGLVYELTKVDPHDFRVDPNWREIENPFTALM